MLAYSTVSQLGYMFLGVGTGAYAAGVFHLVTHAFFKALLFLGAGSVIHAMHHAYHATHSHDDAQDMRNMGGLRQYMPWTFWLMLIATLAIAGMPPFSGFFSKDEILAAAFAAGPRADPYYLSSMPCAWWPRLPHRLLHGPADGHDLSRRATGPVSEERGHLHEAPWIMTGPLVVLGRSERGRRASSTCRPSSAVGASCSSVARAGDRGRQPRSPTCRCRTASPSCS